MKYSYMFSENLRELELLSPYVKDHVIKALTTSAKFLGVYQDFKKRLKDYGIQTFGPNDFASFLRILNNNNSGLLIWYHKAIRKLRPNEKLFLRFVVSTGLRKNEAIQSFNLIIQLHRNSNLGNYHNEELNCLEHFKFKDIFIRRTKNAYISFLPKSVILEIANSKPITYPTIIKRLKRKSPRSRVNELRDYYATFMVGHGLIREVDLLQGRIPPNIFIRHYWSPSFKELRDRTLKAVILLERTFLSSKVRMST